MTGYIDTHAHLEGEEFRTDLPDIIGRAKAAGIMAICIPGIGADNADAVMQLCRDYPGYCFPMLGLHPEEVKDDWQEVLIRMREALEQHIAAGPDGPKYIAIGECGLDFYWSRDYELQQLAAFEEQVQWSVEYGLPLMIHCRKAQNEMIRLMKPYRDKLPGGVFHCFTGNRQEAEAFLQFDNFCLGIGGVATFKKSHLSEDLPAAVPLDRIVLETDSPYMAPEPHRGKRNESALMVHVAETLAAAYHVSAEDIGRITTANANRLFRLLS